MPALPDVVDLTLDLCAIPSVTVAEADVVDHLDQRLRQAGASVARQPVPGPDGAAIAGRDNLLVTAAKGQPIDVLLTTHIDTVPPFIPPKLVGDKETGRLEGRGVIDAKGIAAAMICAWQELLTGPDAPGQRVGLLFVVGEETNSDGAKRAAEGGFVPPVQAFINGEPTDGLLCRAMKGVLAFELHVQGKAGHSAYPEAGHNALHQLLDDLDKLRRESWPSTEFGLTTLNVGVVHGGVAPNVLAPTAVAKLMMRPTAEPEAILARIRALLSSTTTLNLQSMSGPQRLHTVSGIDTCVVAFGSDVPHLSPLLAARHGAPLLLGPGSILDAHTSHEGVAVKDLRAAVTSYAALARRLLDEPPGRPA